MEEGTKTTELPAVEAEH